jgi:LPS O-antigen subunit length determinant protein (WzzB/FepE family)
MLLHLENKLTQQNPENPCREMAGDEIDLIQLFLLLIKRKNLILGVLGLCIILGGTYASVKPIVYEYLTTIEIGSTIKNIETGDIEPIEASEEVLEKVKAAYIPLNSQNENQDNIKVTAASPKGSRLIILKSSGPETSEKAQDAIHKKIAEAVKDDHLRAVRSVRQQLELRIAKQRTALDKIVSADLQKIKIQNLRENVLQKKRNLSSLNDEEQAYKVSSTNAMNKLESALLATLDNQKIEIIGLQNRVAKENESLAELIDKKSTLVKQKQLHIQEKNLLSGQIEALSRTLTDIGQKRLEAPGEVDSPATALTLMMIENQLEQYRSRKDNLEFRIEVDLPQKNNNLEMQLANIVRQIAIQKQLLNDLQTQLTLKKQSQLREVEQHKQAIQNLKSEQNKKFGDYTRQQEVKKSEINEAENQLREYEINHNFAIGQQKQLIQELEAKLAGLHATRTLGIAIRSVTPSGPRKILILALSGMLGLMGGIMLAFFAEFMAKVRREQKTVE